MGVESSRVALFRIECRCLVGSLCWLRLAWPAFCLLLFGAHTNTCRNTLLHTRPPSVPSELLTSYFMTTTASTATTATTTTITSSPHSPIQDATTKSTVAWQTDLEALFHRSKDRFPDVVWALLTEEDGEPTGEEVYGHKGMSSPSISFHHPPVPLFLFLTLSRLSSHTHALTHPHRLPPLSAIRGIWTHPPLQPSYTLALHRASRHDIFPFALLPHCLQAPWMYILLPAFLLSPLSLFLLALKSPRYLAPLLPFVLHLPSHRVKTA